MSPSVSPEPPDFALQSLTSEAVFPQKRGVTTAFEKYATYQEYQVSSPVSSDSTFDVECDRSIDDMETPVDIFNTNLEISLTSEAVFPQKCGVTTAFEKYATYQVSSPGSIDSTFDVECDRSIDDMEAYSAYCQTPVDIFNTNLEIDEWEGKVLSM